MATTKSNYSVLHAERDVMKHRQYGDGDYCSTSIGCRKKSTDETVLVGITRVHVSTHTDRYVYAHVARVTAFGHHRAETPGLFSSVHCADQDRLCMCLIVNTDQLSRKVVVRP